MTISQIQTLINNINDNGENTANEVRLVLNAIRESSCIIGEVKMLKVEQSYITANFDINGLGLTGTQMEGWQIESSDGGRTYIGYDPINYPTLGAEGGSKDAVVVSHTHAFDQSTGGSDGSGTSKVTTGGANYEAGGSFGLSTVGVDGTNRNMQPYRVVLKIKRIA